MATILEIAGALIVLLTLAAAAVIMSQAHDPSALILLLPWALPSILGGVIVAAFGSMLAQLVAIRKATERQAVSLDEVANPRKRVEPIFGRDDR